MSADFSVESQIPHISRKKMRKELRDVMLLSKILMNKGKSELFNEMLHIVGQESITRLVCDLISSKYLSDRNDTNINHLLKKKLKKMKTSKILKILVKAESEHIMSGSVSTRSHLPDLLVKERSNEISAVKSEPKKLTIPKKSPSKSHVHSPKPRHSSRKSKEEKETKPKTDEDIETALREKALRSMLLRKLGKS